MICTRGIGHNFTPSLSKFQSYRHNYRFRLKFLCKLSSQLDPTQHFNFAPCQGWQIPSLRSDWKIIIFLSQYLIEVPFMKKIPPSSWEYVIQIYMIIGIYVYIYIEYIYIYIERHRVYIHRVYMYTDIFFPTSTLSASLHFLEDCRIPNVRPGIG